MSKALETLISRLKSLPGLGNRSAERIAFHLLIEKRDRLDDLVEALAVASKEIGRCPVCGNLAAVGGLCSICEDPRRDHSLLCVVEKIQDLVAMESAGSWRGLYHVLHGKLSPLQNRGPEDINLGSLSERFSTYPIEEVLFAISNDIEGEATCHYIVETVLPVDARPKVSRIGFGLPSGGELTYADSLTLKSAVESRREFQ